MKPEEQRIAIAESFPDLFEIIPGSKDVLRYRNGGCYVDPLKDLNAMHEAEKYLSEKQQVWYMQKLTQVRFKDGVDGMLGCMIDKTTFATAAQRAEALLRTIGKWTDETPH